MRLAAAACSFVLLTLSVLLLRGGVASAHTPAPSPTATRQSGLLGTLLGSLGGTVNGIVGGVAKVLDPPRPTVPTPPAPPSAPPSSALRSTAPDSVTPSAPSSTHTSRTSRPATRASSGPSAHPDHAAHSTRHAAAVAATVPATSHRRPEPRTSEAATAIEPHSTELPGVDVTTALAGVIVVMVLGVGLIVHQAGYRRERGH